MGRNKWKELLGFGRWLITTAIATAPAFQSGEKSQRNTLERNRNKNTYLINNKAIDNTVINNPRITNSTITNSTINFNNTSIHKTEITQQCSQQLSQHPQQQVAEDRQTPKYQQPDIGFESSFE